MRVGEVVDVLQVPAFLCRQTDLLLAAGKTGKPVMVKKGQFLAPQDMKYVAEKVRSVGNENVLFCERGSCFGYRELVVDFRGFSVMRECGAPVIFDVTHSVQVMGGGGGVSSGNREFVPMLARAGVAAGVDGVFLEVHENPDAAPSDGPNMLPLTQFESLLMTLKRIREVV
jgi:2-dehydro-3-deoxyphosphooctonate aldolase (KDO 8-P synthase)